MILAGCGSNDLAADLLDRSIQALREGQANEALKLAERAQSRAPADPCDPLCWRIRLQRAEASLAKGQPESAAALLNPDPPAAAEFGTIRQRRAFLLAIRWRRPIQLEKLLAESKGCLGAKGTEPGTYLDCLLVRAVGTFDAGKREEGERLTREAAAEAASLSDSFRHGLAWVNLSYEYLQERRYDDAAAAAATAVRLTERGPGVSRTNALVNLGAAYRQLGDFERSIARLKEALEGIPADIPLRRLQVLNEIGLTSYALGQRKESGDSLRQSLALARELGNQDELRRVTGNLAMVAIETGDLVTAKNAIGELEQMLAATPSEPASVLVTFRKGRLALAEQRWKDALALFQDVTRRGAEPLALKDAHYYTAVAHRALGDAASATREFENAIGVIGKARRGLGSVDHQISYLTQPIRIYQAYSRHLEERGDRDGAFRVQESSRARVLAGESQPAISVAGLEDLAKRSGAIFLSYWLDPDHPEVRVITGAKHEVIQLSGKPSQIEALVRRHRQLVEEDFADPLVEGSAASRELSDLLLLPVHKSIPPGSRVVLIPDGVLHELNFETLPAPGEPARYWIEDVTISVAPSHSISVQPKRERSMRSLLLTGDPEPAGGFRKLEHAAREIESVRSRFSGEAVIQRGPEATAGAWLAAQPSRFSHIHFATHAKALRDSPLDSFIVLSPDEGKYRLLGRDMLSIELRAELVTLSACQSAGGRAFAGEGMIGLSWALMHAGAGNVIAGLWDVADQSTANLMAALYDGLAQGSSPAVALRAAKLGLLASKSNYRKPFYWGPFQTYSRVIAPSKK